MSEKRPTLEVVEPPGAAGGEARSRRLSMTVSESLYQRLRGFAYIHETYHQQVMADALKEYLERHGG